MAPQDPSSTRRKILLLVTTGGFTHAAPVLEIGAVLASRGHTVEFATLSGQESWTASYPYIKATHIVGPPVPESDLDEHYERMRRHRPEHGIGPVMKSKYLWDRFWLPAWRGVRALCADAASRPDFIVADFFCEHVARDMLHEFAIEIAVVFPQMPYYMAPVSYHSGLPGFQHTIVNTSEHASLLTRIRNELILYQALPTILPWMLWFKRQRRDAGVTYAQPPLKKPDYLVFVNSFFGLEAPKELPPLMLAAGPILSDEFPPLGDDLSAFLSAHDRTVYVSLGTHINLPAEELQKVLLGLIKALDAGQVDGVIWAVPRKPRANFDLSRSYTLGDGSVLSTADLLADKHPRFRLPVFAPQRAILNHPNTVLFVTHGGGSSANEALFHGVPSLCIGYFFDQLCNSERIRAAGAGLSLDKDKLSADIIASAITEIRLDADGSFARNVTRLQRIATIASRRKELAADLVEEVMYDQELRFKDGVELLPMHLQTADVRMPAWKAKNWDLWLVGLTSFVVTGAAGWWAVRNGWKRLPSLMWHLKHSVIIAKYIVKQAGVKVGLRTA